MPRRATVTLGLPHSARTSRGVDGRESRRGISAVRREKMQPPSSPGTTRDIRRSEPLAGRKGAAKRRDAGDWMMETGCWDCRPGAAWRRRTSFLEERRLWRNDFLPVSSRREKSMKQYLATSARIMRHGGFVDWNAPRYTHVRMYVYRERYISSRVTRNRKRPTCDYGKVLWDRRSARIRSRSTINQPGINPWLSTSLKRYLDISMGLEYEYVYDLARDPL
jgi:hypothetical protein